MPCFSVLDDADPLGQHLLVGAEIVILGSNDDFPVATLNCRQLQVAAQILLLHDIGKMQIHRHQIRD